MKHKHAYLFVFNLLLAMLLVACGGGEESVEEVEEAPIEEEVAEAGRTKAPVEEADDSGSKIITIASINDSTNIDPRSNYDLGLATIAQQYETLTYFNPPGSAEAISPLLAESWEANEDRTEWTFTLKQGVKFHDGTDFNADAVKAVVEGVRDGYYATSWIFRPVVDIEIIDDYTIKFTNEYPAALDLIFSSAYGAWMVSLEGMAQDSEWFQAGNNAGTGPYKITNREPGTRIVMERHEEYWRGWNDNKFETVVFEFIPDPTVREQMIRSGDIDLTGGLNPDNIPSLQEAEGVDVKIESSYQNLFIYINHAKKGPLQSQKVRQALTLSYPYEEVLANINGGFGTPAGGIISSSMWGADESVRLTQDLEAAKALLAEAGYPDGGVSLEYWALEGDPLYEQIAELWIPPLRDLGIELTIRVIEGNTAFELAQYDPENALDLMGFFWFPTYVTPFDAMFSLFVTAEYFNLGFYSNKEFESLLFEGQALTASDRDAAIELFQQANRILVEDAAAIFVMDSPTIWTIRDELKGDHYNPAYTVVMPVYDLER